MVRVLLALGGMPLSLVGVCAVLLVVQAFRDFPKDSESTSHRRSSKIAPWLGFWTVGSDQIGGSLYGFSNPLGMRSHRWRRNSSG